MTLTVFITYLILLLAIAIYVAKFSSKGIAEYFIGGGKVNKYVVALSAVVSGRSAWLLLGFSALSYNLGLAAIWAIIGYILVEFWMFWFYAPKLRRYSEGKNIITIPDFFVAKLGDKFNLLRIITVSVILIFMVAYLSSQFVAGGKAFAISFDMTETQGILLTAFIIALYTLIGGFLAVSLTDVIQAILMLIALVGLPILAIWNYGGWTKMQADLLLQMPTFFDLNSIAFASILGFVGIGLGSFGSPHILVRYLSIKEVTDFKFVAILGTFWNISMGIGALFIGFAGRVYFSDLGAFPNGDVENLYPVFGEFLLNPILFGVVIASVFAAIMSTSDSQLLVAASALVRDIYQKIIKKDAVISNDELVRYSRLSVLLIVGFSLLLSLFAKQQIFTLVLFAWGGLGASIGATSLLVLFWKGTNRNGVIAGVLTGTISIIIWKNIPFLNDLIYELIPTFFLTILVTILVSLFSEK
jgi:sodium/proline symporter